MLLIASHPDSILAFRGALISAMFDKGIDVHVAAPDLDAESIVCDTLKGMKVTAHKIPMDRHGVSPTADLALLWHLTKLMRRIQPDVLLNYTAKPIIHGSLAGRLADVRKKFALGRWMANYDRTSPFHGGNGGSNPPVDAIFKKPALRGLFCGQVARIRLYAAQIVLQ